MSWYLANEDGIIGQFASGQGLIDLRTACDHGHYPALKNFLDEGATKNCLLCISNLAKLKKMTLDASVKDTAGALAGLLRGQQLVSITQGMTGFSNAAPKLKESAGGNGKPLNHPFHAERIDPIKRKVKRIVSGYFRRQKVAMLQDVPLRFHVGKEIREADTDSKKRAKELVPESLSPLDFATTAAEDDDYHAAIKRAIDSGAQQLIDELDSSVTIGPSKITEYLEQHSLKKLTGDFSETTKLRLRNAIAAAVDAGGDADDIVGAIKDTMDEFSDQRAELVAQNEVASAYSWGRHQIADEAGLTQKAWIPESGAPCLICIANEAEGWIDITDAFLSGDQFPLAHVNCLCGCDYRLVSSGEGK